MKTAVYYIAGKMTGLPDKGKAHFDAAAERLRRKGYAVLNPGELPENMPIERYMPICLAMVQAADFVYALDNWEDSRGAKLEIDYAKYQCKPIFYESETED